jgi:hypothetical protein
VCMQTVSDDEVVYRHVPNAAKWFEPPDRITSANFKLRKNELGLSVYRAGFISPQQLLTKHASLDGRVASALTGLIRKCRNHLGEFLGLDVIATNDQCDPGHAEIRGPETGKLAPAASKALRDLFQLCVQTEL